jgi:hypothetical protein
MPTQKEAAYTPTGLFAVGPEVGGFARGTRKVAWTVERDGSVAARGRMAPPLVDSDVSSAAATRKVDGAEGVRVWRRR